ncbi:MAG TPA: DnaA N-terminal domain-containing protein [Herpetosiphonaceae bacterium]
MTTNQPPLTPDHTPPLVTLDWTPLVGMTGVFLYAYLTDLAAHQQAQRRTPTMPSATVLQARLGLPEPWQVVGSLYLLTAAGLLQRPPWVPPHAVPAADPPPRVLDWGVLDRVLTALMPALDPTHPEHAIAQAAVRVLSQGGIVQNAEPAYRFYADGAWPDLVPRLLNDARWTRLFTQLHGTAALRVYRRRVRAWVAQAQRARAQRDQEERPNEEPEDGDGGTGGAGSGDLGGSPLPPAAAPETSPATEARAVPCAAPVADLSPLCRRCVASVSPSDARDPEPRATPHPLSLPDQPRVARDPDPRATPRTLSLPDQRPVAGDPDPRATPHPLSLADQLPVAADHDPRATRCVDRPQEPPALVSLPDRDVSLPDRSLTEESLTKDSGNDSVNETASDSGNVPCVARHLRAEELASTRQDLAFWREVHRILTGSDTRYPHTPGEKKAAERRFKRQQIPVGVVLAALRAVMALPDRPRTFGDAITNDTFQAGVQQARALAPTLLPQPPTGRDWHAFLHAYRQIGREAGLRDVGRADYLTLHALFASQPEGCWQVVERWQQQPPPRVSPAALRRALAWRARGAQPPLPWAGAVPARAADDPRRALLRQAGVSVTLLTPGMTADYLRAWIAEADARADALHNRAAWLTWGIRSGQLPHAHPQLRARRASHPQAPPPPPPPPPPPISAEQQAWQQLWSTVQQRLSEHVPAQDYATWLHETALLDLASGEAIVGTPNIFARDKVAATYAPLIAQTLQQQTRQPIRVQVVLEQGLAYGGWR